MSFESPLPDEDAPLRRCLLEMDERLRNQQELSAQGFLALRADLDRAIARLDQQPAVAAPPPAPAAIPIAVAAPGPAASGGDLETILFADDLAPENRLASDRRQLVGDLYRGDPGAAALAGQILIFRAASGERRPPLLKEIGEAYYRWRWPNAAHDDALRDALIDWLISSCEAAGLRNTIEIVRPGDRYDSKRHHAKQQGVEVDEVAGWIVLRDNGKVYTKASVNVR